MKRTRVTHVFLALVALSLFFGSVFERAAESLIIDFIAPRVFFSGVLVITGYLVFLAWEGLTGRSGDRSGPHTQRSMLEVVVILACATSFTAYSGMRIASHLGAGDYRFLLERAIETRGNRCARDELDDLMKEFGDLEAGQLAVGGLQNVEFKLRDYWRVLGTREMTLVVVADGTFERRPALSAFLGFARELAAAASEGQSAHVRVIAIADNSGDDPKSLLGQSTEVIPERDVLLSAAATKMTRSHYESVVGSIGGPDVIFVLAPADQYGKDYSATFYIRPRALQFQELEAMLAELQSLSEEARGRNQGRGAPGM